MHTGSYIDGEWVKPNCQELIRNINPADPDDVIAEFPTATVGDLDRAIAAARLACTSWRTTPDPERGRVIWRAAEIARRRADEIARPLTREEGKVLKEAKGEVMKGISLLEYYAGEGFRLQGNTLPSEARDTFTYTVRQPLGVVGLIAPWNFPWAIPVWKSAPAWVAGNTVIFEPSELTPATAALLTEIYEEAGAPAGVVNMLVGNGPDVGAALSLKAAERGAKVTCEIGGKRPAHLPNGYFVEPTIFDAVTPAMGIFKEEIFGPALSIATAKNFHEGLRYANGVEYGLTTCIFTENIDTIMKFVDEVETGMVHVNEPTIGGEAQLAFGGINSTGVGDREMAEEGLNFFTELKTVFINYSGKAERSMTR